MATKTTDIKKKPIELKNLMIGAALNLFETSTLGQPFEVTKTQMAADRSKGAMGAIRTIYSRGGLFGFYQGLIPWAWIEVLKIDLGSHQGKRVDIRSI